MKQFITEALIKGWGKRQIGKALAVAAPIINANAEVIPEVVGWIIAALIYGTEVFFSYLARRRLQTEAAIATEQAAAAIGSSAN